MATRSSAKLRLKGKARIRSEIVEISRGLHKIGAISDADLEKTTLRMLGRGALPKVSGLSPSEIVKVRE
jgi:putative transcriptional regulator